MSKTLLLAGSSMGDWKSYVSSFGRLVVRGCRGVGRFADAQWRLYEERRRYREAERERLRQIAREGRAYGYGVETGRRVAISDDRRRRKFEAERRRDPTGLKFLLYGEAPQKKRKRR